MFYKHREKIMEQCYSHKNKRQTTPKINWLTVCKNSQGIGLPLLFECFTIEILSNSLKWQSSVNVWW